MKTPKHIILFLLLFLTTASAQAQSDSLFFLNQDWKIVAYQGDGYRDTIQKANSAVSFRLLGDSTYTLTYWEPMAVLTGVWTISEDTLWLWDEKQKSEYFYLKGPYDQRILEMHRASDYQRFCYYLEVDDSLRFQPKFQEFTGNLPHLIGKWKVKNILKADGSIDNSKPYKPGYVRFLSDHTVKVVIDGKEMPQIVEWHLYDQGRAMVATEKGKPMESLFRIKLIELSSKKMLLQFRMQDFIELNRQPPVFGVVFEKEN